MQHSQDDVVWNVIVSKKLPCALLMCLYISQQLKMFIAFTSSRCMSIGHSHAHHIALLQLHEDGLRRIKITEFFHFSQESPSCMATWQCVQVEATQTTHTVIQCHLVHLCTIGCWTPVKHVSYTCTCTGNLRVAESDDVFYGTPNPRYRTERMSCYTLT